MQSVTAANCQEREKDRNLQPRPLGFVAFARQKIAKRLLIAQSASKTDKRERWRKGQQVRKPGKKVGFASSAMRKIRLLVTDVRIAIELLLAKEQQSLSPALRRAPAAGSRQLRTVSSALCVSAK
jgi:hypothetical protein